MIVVLSLAGCWFFQNDPVDDLAAGVLTGDPTSLALASVGDAPEIPPLRPGELQQRAPTGSGLQVLALAPEGEEREPSQVAVIFDRRMVALSALETPVPVQCEPPIVGRARWAGTSTAVIIPEGNNFPGATQYTCKVPAGTAALDGTPLSTAVEWTFATERPAVERVWPRDGADEAELDEPIRLRFNQDIEPDAVARGLTLTSDSGGAVLGPVARGIGANNRADTVEIHPRLNIDTAYTLHLPAGFRGSQGSLTTTAEWSATFHTYRKPALVDHSPEGEGADPEGSIRLEFTTEIDGKEVNDHLSITPTPPDGWKPAQSYTSRWWYYAPRLKPRTAYTVTLRPGITDVHGQKMADGATWTFTTGDLSPTLDVPWGQAEVYPASNPPTLPVRFRNCPWVDVSIERVDPASLLARGDAWYDWEDEDGPQRRISKLSAKDAPNVLQTALVDLGPELVGGFGIFRIKASSPAVKRWDGEPYVHPSIVQVTDLGTTLKLTPDGATVWVTRLSNAEPVVGASVNIMAGGKLAWSGQTDATGLAQAKQPLVAEDWYGGWRDDVVAIVRNGADTSVTAHSWNGGLQGWEHGISESFLSRPDPVVIEGYAERGVYRPGDTVHVAFVAREEGLHALRAPANRALTWTLTDPNGQELKTGTGSLDDTGNWAIDAELPEDGALGDYDLTARVGNAAGNASIRVAEYRAPAFRVDVASEPHRTSGEMMTATVSGRYLFGAPMKAGHVKWSIRRTELDFTPADWAEFRFDAISTSDEWSYQEALEESVSSGEATLDANGQLVVTQALAPENIIRPWNYTVEATVTDADRQQVSNRTVVAVSSAAVYPGVHVKTWLGTAGVPVEAEFVAVDPDGRVAAGTPLRVTAIRRTWDSLRERGLDGNYHWVNNAKDETVTSGNITAGAAAQPWTFTPRTGGLYVIRAESKDKAGYSALAEADVYVTGGDVAWAMDDAKKLELVANKPIYRPGEHAKILVKAPKANMRALVTVEREGIFERRVVTLKSTSDAVDVPITDAMLPNAFVTVSLIRGGAPANAPGVEPPAFWYGIVELKIDTASTLAKVALATDRTTYRPRDTVKIHLEATNIDGKPVANAHVTLWAVDHGVLSLTGYEVPDLHDRFYAPRSLSVLTADNRLSIYDRAARLAKGADVGGGGGYSADLRNKFETTPFWSPNLHTDARGSLDTTVVLPDNLTTFRVMAVVNDGAAAFGKAEREIEVNRPLIARPALPRFLRADDRALAGVVIHNNTEKAADISVTADATGATLKGSPRTVRVDAGGAIEVPFAITNAGGPTVRFHFEATGGGNHDAVETEIPVRAARVTEVVATAGSTTTTSSEQVEPPKDAAPGVGGLDLDLSASALVGMGSAVDYLVDYPYGCIEQVSSRLRVAILAKRLHDRAGLATSPEQLESVVQAGLSALQRFKTAGGGMSYWPGESRPSPIASAYALEVLAEARRAGYQVDDKWFDELGQNTLAYATGDDWPDWWDDATKWTAITSMSAQLARAGKGDAALNNRAWDYRGLVPQHARAEGMEAILRTTGADSRTASTEKLLASALHMEATSAALEDKDADRWLALWVGDDLGTSAFVRALLAEAKPNPVIERLVAHLVDARTEGRWANTYSTASALTALADYSDRYEKGSVFGTVTLAGAPILAKDLGVGGSATARVPMTALKPGALLLTATGGGRLYYEARLAYSQAVAPPRDEGFSLARTIAVIDGTGAGNSVSPGALLRVTLRVVTPVDRYHVAVYDPLPAGLEPVDTTFATTANDVAGDTGGPRDTGFEADAGWWSTWVFNRRELRDDGVALFADRMPAGIHVQSYLARATTPGDYAQPAARVEEMYKPEVYGRTEAGRFVVGLAVAKK